MVPEYIGRVVDMRWYGGGLYILYIIIIDIRYSIWIEYLMAQEPLELLLGLDPFTHFDKCQTFKIAILLL